MFEKWRIKEHMEVLDASGRHLGTVDEIEGDTIKLTRTDSADGQHHYIAIDHVDSISDEMQCFCGGCFFVDLFAVDVFVKIGKHQLLVGTIGFHFRVEDQ